MKYLVAIFVALLTVASTAAEAKHHHRHYAHHSHRVVIQTSQPCASDNNGRTICTSQATDRFASVDERSRRINRGNPTADGNCPAYLGCGCNLANYFHIAGRAWRELWVARNWAHYGSAAFRGCIGCVAVLPRGRGGHVGVVKDYDPNGNPVVYSYANGRLGWTTTTYSARRVLAYRSI